jgi:Homeobox KN domain/Tc5 transposase DNA-binding domain
MEYFDFDQAAFTEHDQQTDLSGVQLQCDALTSPEGNVDDADFLLRLGDDFISYSQPFDPSQDTLMDDIACFDDFQSWIPKTSKPAAPCDCCRRSKFECLVVYEGQSACSSCIALSKPCSFAKAPQLDSSGEPNSIPGTVGESEGLHSVEEDGVPEVLSRPKKSGVRFSRAAVSILKAWFNEHSAHPYPTDKEKDELKKQTGLKRSQISNWLANTRRRSKISSGRSAIGNGSISGRNFIPLRGIDVPTTLHNTSFEDMNPLERWKHSPPENEPASVAAIYDAVAKSKYSADKETPSLSTSWLDNHRSDCSSTASSFSVFKAPSMASLETGRSSGGSDFSFSSVFSHQSRRSFCSFPVADKKDRRRRRRPTTSQKSDPGTARMFQCTFCTDSFKTKHDWQRHEKTQHIPLESWTCAKYGAVIVTPTSVHCAYCNLENLKSGHLETHNFQQCMERSIQERTFYRKDHLRQHLRLAHGCTFRGQMESWKEEVKDMKSRCGFCDANFTTWQARVDHIAAHFRAGTKMSTWKGDWGFEPQILETVENAMPPYLIEQERSTLQPFSATNSPPTYEHLELGLSAWIADHRLLGIYPTDQMIQDQARYIVFGNDDPWGLSTDDPTSGSQALIGCPKVLNPNLSTYIPPPEPGVCYKVLERELVSWIGDQIARGIIPSDAMIQEQARIIIYSSDDSWNQTAADNSEWLEMVKRKNGWIDDHGRWTFRAEGNDLALGP